MGHRFQSWVPVWVTGNLSAEGQRWTYNDFVATKSKSRQSVRFLCPRSLLFSICLLTAGCAKDQHFATNITSNDQFKDYYGFVLVFDGAKSAPYCLQMSADRRYVLARAGQTLWAGYYELERGALCLAHMHNPMAMCLPFRPDPVVGDPWDGVSPNGRHLVLALKPRDQAVECGAIPPGP